MWPRKPVGMHGKTKRLNVPTRNPEPGTRNNTPLGGRYAPYGFRFASETDRTLLPDPVKGPARDAILAMAGEYPEINILTTIKRRYPEAAPGGGWTVTKIRDIIWREARKKGMS